jgi:SAM-dependent methyltransferase
MDSSTAARLIEINREFYSRFGDSFSATRRRIQPGVRRVLHMLDGNESILDLGCGNGEFARELAKRGHGGPYLGVDFSLPLLRDAQAQPGSFPAKFVEADLTQLPAFSDQLSVVSKQLLDRSPRRQIDADKWSLIAAFAVLHHIPSTEKRLNVLRTVHHLLAEDGKFILSNWQFLNSEKLKARIKPWEELSIQGSEVDAGDYLLDWRRGGAGLRYVHHFSETELSSLAEASGFLIHDQFYADGASGDLALYQIWTGVNNETGHDLGHKSKEGG